MSKHENDAHTRAAKLALSSDKPPGEIVPSDRPVTELLPVKRLAPVPGRVDRADLAVIIRAITLHLARSADLDDDSLEKSGKSLVEICRFYIKHERSHPHANEDPP